MYNNFAHDDNYNGVFLEDLLPDTCKSISFDYQYHWYWKNNQCQIWLCH